MKRLLLTFFIAGFSLIADGQDNPVADPKAVVRSGFARFTVLTPQTVRLQYDTSGHFDDAASLVVINRKLPVPVYSVKDEDGWFVLTTSVLELRYFENSGSFSAANLFIRRLSDSVTWHPGLKQKENLGGTLRTLDGMMGDSSLYAKRRIQIKDGLLARDGWTLIDDSEGLRFDGSDWPWVMPKSKSKAIDWYYMSYGHNYKSALLDYTRIAGKIPLPPRYAFGYWWSRYWAYSDNELRDLVDHFHRYRIPLDVLVIDMDWHKELSKDQWTGWTFNDAYFTDSKPFLNWLHAQKLKVTLNLHPAFGVSPGEAAYPAMAKTLGVDTGLHKAIPFAGSDKKFMASLFSDVLKPLEKQGVDFWWLDWQQTANDKAIPQLSNTWWLNYTFFSEMQRSTNKRPLIYHRWGGLGNHRYQIGFSGDTYISWASLAYQPYVTNTASNVLYGYWSHDIGGHMSLPGESGIDPELYTRWMQYGALSPMFRTHSSKSATLNKELWNFKGEYFDALTAAVRLRYQLAPYIYSMARKAYDTGISLCRPLYYDYPEEKEAYSNKTEYFFGDDVLVAPIGNPMVDGRSTVSVWLPPGNDWYEWHTGTLLKGGQTVTRAFSITEYPIYVKAGAIIPMYPDTLQNLQQQPGKQIFALFPGSDNSSTTLYEDNGDDQHYDKSFAVTKITTEAGSSRIIIWPRKGSYAGIKLTKDYEIKLYGTAIPERVLVNGKPMAFTYNGADLALVVDMPKVNCSAKTVINIQYKNGEQAQIDDGLVERMERIRYAVKALKYRNADLVVSPAIGHMEELNRELEYHPQQFYQLISQFNNSYNNLGDLVKALQLSPEDEGWFLKQLQ